MTFWKYTSAGTFYTYSIFSDVFIWRKKGARWQLVQGVTAMPCNCLRWGKGCFSRTLLRYKLKKEREKLSFLAALFLETSELGMNRMGWKTKLCSNQSNHVGIDMIDKDVLWCLDDTLLYFHPLGSTKLMTLILVAHFCESVSGAKKQTLVGGGRGLSWPLKMAWTPLKIEFF